MVQINLLPGAAKRRRRIEVKLQTGPVIYSLIPLVLIIIVVLAALGLRLKARQRDLSRFDKELASVKSNLEKLEKLNADKKEFLSKLEFIDRSLKREIHWARNLNQLSSLIPMGIWLKRITLRSEREDDLDKYENLEIEGSVISLQGEEMIQLIGGFMTALKKDEIFSEQFSQIKLVSSQRSKSGNIETMNFKLVCQFK
jgi:Tfp pilus assembly protein PilN